MVEIKAKKLEEMFRPARPMKYPYTYTAKIFQFPWKFYYRNNWIFRYYFVGVLLSIPVFYKIERMANSPGNKAKWAEMKEREEIKHRERHLH